jgi:festuclavine dehydrogenase
VEASLLINILSPLQVASKLSKCLGREIVHVRLSEAERVQQYLSKGLPDFYAGFLTFLEVGSAGGMEERLNDDVEKVTGRPPQKFDDWVQENKAVWE